MDGLVSDRELEIDTSSITCGCERADLIVDAGSDVSYDRKKQWEGRSRMRCDAMRWGHPLAHNNDDRRVTADRGNADRRDFPKWTRWSRGEVTCDDKVKRWI